MSRGLAPVQTTSEGSMVVFSAAPGQVAQDGSGANSPFAEALVRHLPTENAEVLSLMKRVIRDVKAETGDAQVPMVTNDLVTEIYLNLGAGGAGAALAFQQEETIFEAALAIGTQRAWDIYLSRYPQGNFREIALAERERLQVTQLAEASGVQVVEGQPIAVTPQVAQSLERSLGLAREDAIAVQTALVSKGFNVGTVDGDLGPRTRRAVADFQAAAGLPATGVLTMATVSALGIEINEAESGSVILATSSNARRYDAHTLSLIESDNRLLSAVRELEQFEISYGFFAGKLYIALITWGRSWDEIARLANRTGGHLATLSSREESAFLADLVGQDERFWRVENSGFNAFGPAIGLVQAANSREPDGGWSWVTGEPIEFSNWAPGEPNHYNGKENFGVLQSAPSRDGSVDLAALTMSWGDVPGDSYQSAIIEIE